MKVLLKRLNGDQVEITDLVSSVSGSRSLNQTSSTFTVLLNKAYSDEYLNIIEVYDEDYILRFAGLITDQTYSQGNTLYNTSLGCTDFSYLMHNRIIADRYDEEDELLGKPHLIFKDIISKHVEEFTCNAVKEATSSIQKISFKYETVFDALNKLCSFLSNYYWYVGFDKDVHFFKDYEKEGPELNDSNILINTVSITGNKHKIANRVWILGSKKASEKYIDEYFVSDGKTRIHKLSYVPNYYDVYINGSIVESGLEKNKKSTHGYVINKKDKLLIRPDELSVVPSGQEVRIRYRPTKEIVDFFENPPSIKEHGLYEMVIKNKDLTDKLEARRYGRAALKKSSIKKRGITFSTLEKNVSPGEKIKVGISKLGIESSWIVETVNRNILPTNSFVSISAKELT